VVLGDEESDIAILRLDEARDLPSLALRDSDHVEVGELALAIGNPFGVGQTVSSGIVSGLARSGAATGNGRGYFIQTDAPINPGNSGGALVDLAGNLVGINTAIFAPSGGNVGIGFAIPANMVRAVMEQIIEHGEVRRGYPGVEVQALTADLAEAFGVDRTEGVVVVEVDPEGPAERAGLRPGDVVVRVGERQIRRKSDYDSRTAVLFAGDEVTLEVLRDGRPKRLELAIDDSNSDRVAGRRVHARLKGVVLQNFHNDNEPNTSAGVLITEVEEQSKAYVHGLRAGDVLVAANRQAVRNIVDLREAAGKSRGQLLLRVYRAGEFGYVVIR
jgi:serine protease Do/serine protease DegQ